MLQRLWTTATQGRPRDRVLVWLGIVALMALSSVLPMALGIVMRGALIGVAFALIAAALAPHQTKAWRRVTVIALGAVWLYALLAVTAGELFGRG